MATQAQRRQLGVVLHHVALHEADDVYIKDVWGTFLDSLADWLDVDLRLFAPNTRDLADRFQHYPVSRSRRMHFSAGPSFRGGSLLRMVSEVRGLDAALIFLPTLQGLGSALACTLTRTPFVVYSGLGKGEWNAPGIATRVRSRTYGGLERFALHHARGAIAAGTEVEEQFSSWLPTFRTAPITGVVSEGPRTSKERVVLYVGALSERKGVPELLAAWGQLPDAVRKGWSLRIAGAGELESRVAAFARDRRDCELLGYIEHGPELFRHYREAGILVLPSRNEGFPRVLTEAAGHGCALAATQVGGVPAAFSDDYSPEWIAPGAAGDLARALTTLMDGAWVAAGESARQWFRARFAERDRALEAAAFIATQVPEIAER